MPPVPELRCPICGKGVKPEDPFLPFCSDRCRVQDLANWATEKYVIWTPVEPTKQEDEEE